MKRAALILAGVILIMNITNAFGEVSYRTIRVDDLDIFYREAGPEDGPTILLLHGLQSSSPDVWDRAGSEIGSTPLAMAAIPAAAGPPSNRIYGLLNASCRYSRLS